MNKELSETALNDQLVARLAKQKRIPKPKGEIPAHKTKKLNCIVGGSDCLYKDKQSLVDGKISILA